MCHLRICAPVVNPQNHERRRNPGSDTKRLDQTQSKQMEGGAGVIERGRKRLNESSKEEGYGPGRLWASEDGGPQRQEEANGEEATGNQRGFVRSDDSKQI